MKRTISRLLIFMAVCLATAACKQNKQEDPLPASATKEKGIYFAGDEFVRYLCKNGSHILFTAPEGNMNTSSDANYTYEGRLCGYLNSVEFADLHGFKQVVPLYAYENRMNGDNFYTTNFSELGNGNTYFKYYGAIGYVLADTKNNDPSLLEPIYRYYNPLSGFHFYTNNANELATNNHGYRYEGIGFYGVKPYY